MPPPLPKPIELFMSSENTHDLEALADCFAAHATVRDEDFPGSPISLDFVFTLEGGKIAALEIHS
jgi:hypothetical protein